MQLSNIMYRKVDIVLDVNEYETLVRKYQSQVFRYCYYKLNKDESLAEETFNDVLEELFKKWDTLERGENIKAYLYRVADMCIKHNLRLQTRYYIRNESLEATYVSNGINRISEYDDYFLDDVMSEEERLKQIEDSLPDEYKKIFVYRFVEKKTINETASLTGIPYSSLRLRLKKIEKLVREEISKIFN